MHELKKVVQNLEEDEAKTMLFLLLLRISMLEETNYSVEEFTKDLLQTYKDILRISTKQNKTITDYTATHIVFGDSASGSLKMALRDMGLEDTERVFALSDMFSIGPIWNLHEDSWART